MGWHGGHGLVDLSTGCSEPTPLEKLQPCRASTLRLEAGFAAARWDAAIAADIIR